MIQSARLTRAGRDVEQDMDDTLEQPKPSNFNISSTRDEDREQDSSGDEGGGLDWTKLPYVHLPLD